MKKIFAALLCFTLVCSLMTGCAKNTEKPEVTPSPAGDTSEAPEADTDVVKEKAMAYFRDFPEDKHVISSADLFVKMDAGEDMLLLDIRQPDAYAAGHLKGAVNVPYGSAIPEALEFIPDDVPVYINCYTGQTSSQTTALLNVAGKFAYNIQSGYDNGIAATDNYENYIETTENPLGTDTYEVDATVKAALTDYYSNAGSDTFKNFNFDTDSLKELVDAESDQYTILSIRQAADYDAGHIAGAINIPYGKGMQDSFSQIPADKPVIVYCYTGQTASQTSAILRLLGYEAYNLSGGMGVEGGEGGWLGKGNPVVTD